MKRKFYVVALLVCVIGLFTTVAITQEAHSGLRGCVFQGQLYSYGEVFEIVKDGVKMKCMCGNDGKIYTVIEMLPIE